MHHRALTIELGRNLLNQTWIDEGNNAMLLDAFSGFRTEEKANMEGVFQLTPAHTWERHFADAFMCYAKARKVSVMGQRWKPLKYDHRVVA